MTGAPDPRGGDRLSGTRLQAARRQGSVRHHREFNDEDILGLTGLEGWNERHLHYIDAMALVRVGVRNEVGGHVNASGKAGQREVERYPMGVLPWFVSGVALSITIAIFACRPIGRLLGVRRLVTWAILVGFGEIVSATLTPLRGALNFGAVGTSTCDLSRIGLAPIAQLIRLDDTSLNVALFIPLGIAIGLVQASGPRAALILSSIALPFGIETIQLFAPILDRGCQSADVVDNLTGLLIGLATGTALRLLGRRWRMG